MALDRLIALIFLIIALIYGFAAFSYPLLPFERNAPVLPNTLPKALSVIGALITLFILLAPRATPNNDVPVDPDQDTDSLNLIQTGGLIFSMVLYALLLRPIGFIAATSAFLIGTATLLGERRWLVLLPIALIAAFAVWLLVQQVLGIYLKPWPMWVG